MISILQRTGMIVAIIQKLLDVFGNSGAHLTIILMIVVAIGGATLGMGGVYSSCADFFDL